MTTTAPPATEATTSLDHLNDDVVTAILLRLPPAFVAAHARRRPLELLVQRDGANGVLDTIPLPSLDDAGRRCLLPGYPECGVKFTFARGYSLVDSCDGLLLFEGHPFANYLVCDPTSRQWAELPPAHHHGVLTLACGFYLHGPSGEHRLLFLANGAGWGEPAAHFVHSLEAGETRRLGPSAEPVDVNIIDAIGAAYLEHRGKLHWVNHPEAKQADKILSFDTVSETFRRMARPPARDCLDRLFLLELDGKLAMTAILDGSMDLWVLGDYSDDESWTRRLRVDLSPPLTDARWAMRVDDEGQNNVMILLGNETNCTLGLYDLTERRVLKHIQVADGTIHVGPWGQP
ncbi:hypothetical protein ACP70R_033815 [Stipagrostis hirtigluma subsp. patula]